MIDWITNFTAKESSVEGDITRLSLKGVLIDTTKNKNSWMIEESDFQELSKKYLGKQIRIDHGEKVSDVKGVIKNTEIDSPHTEWKEDWDPPNEFPHIHFFGEVATADKDVIIPLRMGFVNQVSPGVDAKTVLCSVCKKPIEHGFKQCSCEGSVSLLKDIEPRELSIIASPAYKNTLMKPYGFAAAVDKLRGEYMTEEVKKDTTDVEDRMKKLEAAVTAIAMKFKAEEEEEERIHTGEEEEEPKKTVPITRVAEKTPEEEEVKEEEEKKAEEEEEKKQIKELVAQVRALKAAIASFKADDGKITPDTPEDEPEWKVIKPPQITNEPVKSTKTDKIFQTPSMRPGPIKAPGKVAGVSAPSFTGQVASKEVVENKALEEVFSFAAGKGVIPMRIDYKVQTIRV